MTATLDPTVSPEPPTLMPVGLRQSSYSFVKRSL
jgi:hypothetical protein